MEITEEFKKFENKLIDFKEHHNISYYKNIKFNIDLIVDFWKGKSENEKNELQQEFKKRIQPLAKKYTTGELRLNNFIQILNDETKYLFNNLDIIIIFEKIFYEWINAKDARSKNKFVYGLLDDKLSNYFNFFVEIVDSRHTNINLKGIGNGSKKGEVIAFYNYGTKELGLNNSQYHDTEVYNYTYLKNNFIDVINNLSAKLKIENIDELKQIDPNLDIDILKKNSIIDKFIWLHNEENKKKEKAQKKDKDNGFENNRIIDASKKALKLIKRNASKEEIYQLIINNNLYVFNAENPIDVLRVQIERHSANINRNDSSNEKIFFKDSNGLFGLLEWDNNIINILQYKKQIILYGPPGTGKTYNTKNIIYNFIKGNELLKYNEKKIIEDKYLELDKQGRVKFITFHQSYSYEEFIEGLKPIEGKKEEELERDYRVEPGIFKEFVELAKINWKRSQKKKIDFEGIWKDFLNSIDKTDAEEIKITIEMSKKGYYFNIYQINNSTIYFEKKDGDRTHTLCIDTLKKFYKDKTVIKGGLEPYYKALIKFLDNQYQKVVNEKEEPYFLIIDEINRGNISKIFGELITLLESDKRLGQDDELIVELPYSKEKFGIPPNLYIIATMNTSDKSIANLDIALRRRFGFKELLPDSDLISEKNCVSECNNKYYQIEKEIKLNELLKQLNKRIEYVLDKDHTLGHSYFMKVNSLESLKETFYDEIIPLLEEYFYGDYEKMRLVLGSGFITEIDFNKELFEKNDEFDTESKSYELIDFRNNNFVDWSFEKAVNKILNPKFKLKEESNETK